MRGEWVMEGKLKAIDVCKGKQSWHNPGNEKRDAKCPKGETVWCQSNQTQWEASVGKRKKKLQADRGGTLSGQVTGERGWGGGSFGGGGNAFVEYLRKKKTKSLRLVKKHTYRGRQTRKPLEEKACEAAKLLGSNMSISLKGDTAKDRRTQAPRGKGQY